MTTEVATLAQLLEELPDVVAVLDAEGHVLWANARAEAMFGVTWEEYQGRSALDLVHPDDLELVGRSLVSIQNKEIGTTLEVRAKTPSGWRLLELIGTPVSWFAQGAVLFSMRDMTDRRRFEVAHDEVARFRGLIHNATAITLLVSPVGDIECASAALTRMLGHDPEHVEYTPLASIVLDEDRTALSAAMERASRMATVAHPVTVEVRLLRREGIEAVPFELSVVLAASAPGTAPARRLRPLCRRGRAHRRRRPFCTRGSMCPAARLANAGTRSSRRQHQRQSLGSRTG